MNKKKITAIILACVVILGGIAIGLNKTKTTKANDKAKVETTKKDTKEKQTTEDINDVTSPNYIPKAQQGLKGEVKKEVQVINGKKITTWRGDYSCDPYYKTPWMNGKKVDFLKGTYTKRGVQVGTVYSQHLIWESEKVIKNAIIADAGIDDSGHRKYLLINYTKPYVVKDENSNVTMIYGKVVSADSNGIKLDNGQYYNCSNALTLLQGDDYDINKTNKFNPSDFPKNTLVMVVLAPNVHQVNRYCIIK